MRYGPKWVSVAVGMTVLAGCQGGGSDLVDPTAKDPNSADHSLPLNGPYCGFDFEEETDAAALAALKQDFTGHWLMNGSGYTVVDDGTRYHYSREGFRFSAVEQKYGRLTFLYDSLPADPRNYTASKGAEYNQVKFSKPLTYVGFEGYRAIEASELSNSSCSSVTSLFKLSDDKSALTTVGSTSSLYYGAGKKPPLLELLSQTVRQFTRLD